MRGLTTAQTHSSFTRPWHGMAWHGICNVSRMRNQFAEVRTSSPVLNPFLFPLLLLLLLSIPPPPSPSFSHIQTNCTAAAAGVAPDI